MSSGLRMMPKLNSLLHDQRGVSLVEFGLVAPVLIIGLLTAIDYGMASFQKMTLDSVLRTGAQRAMADPGTAAVHQALLGAASGAGGQVANASFPAPERFCACPTATNTPVVCTSTCGGLAYTYIYYRLRGDTMYRGVFLSRNVSSTALVQIR